LALLTLQQRQVEEQAQEQVKQLREAVAEQITQLKRDGDLRITQLQNQARRQIELLDAQKRLIQAEAGITLDATRPLTQGATVRARTPALLSPAADEALGRVLDRLDRLDQLLERLERRASGDRSAPRRR
jgi:hypothetical protein